MVFSKAIARGACLPHMSRGRQVTDPGIYLVPFPWIMDKAGLQNPRCTPRRRAWARMSAVLKMTFLC